VENRVEELETQQERLHRDNQALQDTASQAAKDSLHRLTQLQAAIT
jgi:outer membrane murein-binding lipoprotein Lpp